MTGLFHAAWSAVCRVAGLVAAWLPRRAWDDLDAYVPVTSSAVPSGILTLLAGFVVGIPGFMEHAGLLSRGYIGLLLDAADRGTVVTRDLAVGMNAFSLFTFVLLTPKGWITIYLVLTGFYRAVSAWFDDPRGDPILSLADAGARAVLRRSRSRQDARHRERLEGPATRDVVVSGARAGLPGAELVIIASRRKAEWDPGTVVITPGGSYRVGEIVERTIEGRLRTLYPLTEHRDLETFRRIVHYELPPRHENIR